MIARRTNTDLTPDLRAHMDAIKAKAIEYGLDFHEVVFEVLDFRTMNMIASQGGFPTRYPHWRWGMEYEKLSRRDAYGMGRIYEMVINNDPCYAYLQESNGVGDQKLVMAHVYGHADFFKCNAWFSKTDQKMMNTMANHATRVQRHIDRHGRDAVERFLDACLGIEFLIDPYSVFSPPTAAPPPSHTTSSTGSGGTLDDFEPSRLPAKPYMDRFVNPESALRAEREAHAAQGAKTSGSVPTSPSRDVLRFLLERAPLADWQRDLLSIVRDESYYFVPQAMTKVMNEGWATYWHSKMMTGHFLEAKEIVDYAEQHSGVVHMPAGGFNPYKVGLEMFKDIERRWNRGQHGPAWERLGGIGERDRYDDHSMRGREKIFEIRRVYNDVNFIDEFLTPEFVERHNMYRYQRDPNTGELRVVSRDFEEIKQALLFQITNMGQPFIYVVDGNYLNRGELYLAHRFAGLEVDAGKAGEVLRGVRLIWGRPVHLQMRVNDEMRLLTCTDPGEPITGEKIGEDTPAPAHMIDT
jgi:stage V sporulation protein R